MLVAGAGGCGCVVARSGDDDYLDTDCVVSAACPGVSGSQGSPVLLRGQCHERVVDGAACDAEAAERVRQGPGATAAQHQGRREAGLDQAGRVGGRQPGVAGQPGQDGVGLGEGMTAEGDLLAVPPAGHGRMLMM